MKIKIGQILERVKEPIEIKDDVLYKRLTIRINHHGVTPRDIVKGASIGTKNQFKVTGGDFILSKIDARQGAFGIIPIEANGAIITGNFWAYRLKNNSVNIDWFLHFTESNSFLDLCKRTSSGNTHRKYLNEVEFLNHELEIPDMDEQIRIVENIKLCRLLDGEIDLLKKRVGLLIESIHSKAFN